MNLESKSLVELVEALPGDLQSEVRDFVEFLIEKRKLKSYKPAEFKWQGALSDLKNQYTSVDLQHKTLDWWGD